MTKSPYDPDHSLADTGRAGEALKGIEGMRLTWRWIAVGQNV